MESKDESYAYELVTFQYEDYGLIEPEVEHKYDISSIQNSPKAIAILIFLITTFILGIALNGTFLFQQIRLLRLKSIYGVQKIQTILKINLVVTNILLCLFSILLDIIWKRTFFWLGGNAMCKIMMFLRPVSLHANVYSVIALLASHLTNKTKSKGGKQVFENPLMYLRFLVPVWVYSTAVSTPQLWIFRTASVPWSPTPDSHVQCIHFEFFDAYWKQKLYFLAHAVSLLFLPILIMVSLSIATYRITKLENRQRTCEMNEEGEEMQQQQPVETSGTAFNNQQLPTSSESERETSDTQTDSNNCDEVAVTNGVDATIEGEENAIEITLITTKKFKMSEVPLVVALVLLLCMLPYTFVEIVYLCSHYYMDVWELFYCIYLGPVFIAVVLLMDSNMNVRWF